jgi:hypothetical protein
MSDDDIVGVIGPVEAKRLDHVLSVRLQPDVAAALRDIANERGTTVSELLRRAAIAAANEPNVMRIEWLTPPTVSYGNGTTAVFTAPPSIDDEERAELELLRAQRQTLLQMLTHIDGVGDRHNGPYPQAAWVTSDTIRDILGTEGGAA